MDEIFRIESNTGSGENSCVDEDVEKRKKPDCDHCKDDREMKCVEGVVCRGEWCVEGSGRGIDM